MNIKIGTRGSKLALWQANWVKNSLEEAGVKCELVTYLTSGDKNWSVPLRELGVKGIFTKALDDAILNEEVDIAVHSAKDLPSQLEEGLELAAITKREDPRDVVLSCNPEVDLDNLTKKFIIGTSSVRRSSFIKHFSPGFQLKDIRGNLDTRIAKLDRGEYDALILAYAGVKRMGYTHKVTRKLNVSSFTPAVAQGAVACVMKSGHPAMKKVNEVINHNNSRIAVDCERAFLNEMGGGCHEPVFGLATVVGTTISFNGGKAELDGSKIYRYSADEDVSNAVTLGKKAAEMVLLKQSAK